MRFTDLIARVTAPRRDPVRDYLDQSVSRVDLERRQREIDDGRFRSSRYPY